MIALGLGAVFVFCTAVLYSCDVATIWLFANPNPRWAVAVRILGFLSTLSLIGFYLSTIGLVVAAATWLYASLSPAGDRPELKKFIITCVAFAGLYAAGVSRHLIALFAGGKRFASVSDVLPPHAGESEPWFVALHTTR